MSRVEVLIEDMADRGPGIWFGSTDFISRLDHPEYVTHLSTLNMRDLRMIKALLKCATDHVNIAIDAERVK